MRRRRYILYKTFVGYLHLHRGRRVFIGPRQGAAEFRTIEDAIAAGLQWDGARVLDAKTGKDIRL